MIYYMEELTLEKIEEVLEEIFKDVPPPKFHPSVEEEVNKLLKENLDKFYLMDYSTGQSFVHVGNLKKLLEDNGYKE